MVCTGQPVLIAGDLNADPAVTPCLAKPVSEGRFVDLAWAYSPREGKRPAATCKFNLGVPMRLLLALLAWSLIGGFLLILLCLLPLVSCPIVSQPLWPACWIDTPDTSSSSTSRPPLLCLVRFRMPRLKSVADVLQGIRNKALLSLGGMLFWVIWVLIAVMVRHGPCGPISSIDPWDRWIPPDLHDLYVKWHH